MTAEDKSGVWLIQVTTLSDFFHEETVFVAFGTEKYSAEQLLLSEEGRYTSNSNVLPSLVLSVFVWRQAATPFPCGVWRWMMKKSVMAVGDVPWS